MGVCGLNWRTVPSICLFMFQTKHSPVETLWILRGERGFPRTICKVIRSAWSHRSSGSSGVIRTYIISTEVTHNLPDCSNSQSNGPVGQQAAIRGFTQLLLAAADPFPHGRDAVRFGPLVRAAAAAGGGEQAGASLGEPRLGGGQQEQHQYQTPRQQRDANAGRKHCPSAGSHLSCTPASSHPIPPPWSSRGWGGVKEGEKKRNNLSGLEWALSNELSAHFREYSAPVFQECPVMSWQPGRTVPFGPDGQWVDVWVHPNVSNTLTQAQDCVSKKLEGALITWRDLHHF